MKKSPNEIINDYREAIRLNYGDEKADKSYFYYSKGWYYFEMARNYLDGSCGVLSSIHGYSAYREKEIIKRTEVLISRVNGEEE